MKELFRNLLKPLRKLIQYLFTPQSNVDYWKLSPYKTSLVLLYQEKMMESSLQYALTNFKHCLNYYNRNDLWNYTVMLLIKHEEENREKLNLEFGVWKGESINYFGSRLKNFKFYGFDSFEGLKEDWTGHSFGKGHFDVGGILPRVNSNVTLIKGWFDQTLPAFLENEKCVLGFIHIDCDTYESTKTIFNLIRQRIVPGTYILFDEYIGYSSWQAGEFKAFQEFIAASNSEYEYLAFSNQSVLVRIL